MKYEYKNEPMRMLSPIIEEILDICQQELKLTDVQIPIYVGSIRKMTGAATKGHLDDKDNPRIEILVGVPIIMHMLDGDFFPLIYCLCHEMIHVQQDVSGRLFESEKGIVWEGKLWPASELNATMNVVKVAMDGEGPRDQAATDKYRNYPWEVEAYREGPKLVEKVRQILEQKYNKKAA